MNALASPFATSLPISHDRNVIDNMRKLFHLVRDVDDGDAGAFQFSYQREQCLDLGVRQRRSRLVHDEYSCIER